MESCDDIFLNAREIAAPGERTAYLDRACGNDAALRQRVEAMLWDAEGAGKFFSPDKTTMPIAPGALPQPPIDTMRYFGDYELLEEIARGGMGVVYKARQTSLNRIVAIKMILSGRLASDEEVKRFHLEAEAAANLQHPHIVAIHEVGQHKGRHYFSMDYVAGNNLAQAIKDKPLAPSQAAELLKTIAEAVHFAHQRGTLHRDLKPQNILIDASGQPRVTDFGLAKRTTTDTNLTQTGAVMGSPGYMPPEQAMGKQEMIGPASDVYSLGAMLYYLLTGVAPFLAETPVATMKKVMDEQPVAPSRLNGKTPADLETISLKCMEKRPERRYHSARELAEELARFLNQEPILAKPAGMGRKAWGWLVRNPWALTGTAAILVLGLTGLAFGFWEQNRALKWSMAHGGPAKPASDWPFNSGLATGLLILNSLILAPFSFADFVGCKRRNLSMTSIRRLAHGTIGIGEVLLSLGLSLRGIQYFCWNGFSVNDITLFGVCLTTFIILPPIWFGALLLWHLAADIRRASFGLQNPQEQHLFPSAPAGISLLFRPSIGQIQTMNLSSACVLVVVVTALLIYDKNVYRVVFANIALLAGVATEQLFAYRNSKSADRWLSLFGCGFCAMVSLLMYFQSIKSSPFESLRASPWDRADGPKTQWAQTIALALGLGGGLFIAKMKSRLANNTPTRACQRLLPNVESLCQRLSGVLLFIIVISGFYLFPKWNKGVSCFCLLAISPLLPWQFLIWRMAEGVEKRAQGYVLLNWSALLTLVVMYNPWREVLETGLFGLVAGFVMLASFLWLERRAANRLAAKSV